MRAWFGVWLVVGACGPGLGEWPAARVPDEVPLDPLEPPGDTGRVRVEESAPEADADRDGVTVKDGDCDDHDPSVRPGVADRCDGVDADCDGFVDEDFEDDELDAMGLDAWNLGDLGAKADVRLDGYLHPIGDVDTFRFEAEDDSLSSFEIEAILTGFPAEVDAALELWWSGPDGDEDPTLLRVRDERGEGDFEILHWGGTPAHDDSGHYELRVVAAEGASCSERWEVHLVVGEGAVVLDAASTPRR